MVSTLIICFFIFILTLTIYLFKVGFIKGELFDFTKSNPKKGSKLEKYLNQILEGTEYINNTEHEWIYIYSVDGLKLAGRYFKNVNTDKLIILFHGYRSIPENDFGPIFKLYYELGYSILLVDQRSHGRSEGKYITFGVKERFDCLKWCEYVNDNFDEINEIVLGGMSMGATTVLLASGLELPYKVKGIISDCGFTSPKDIISKVVNARYGIDATVLLPFVNMLCVLCAKFNLYECSVLDAMKSNKLPILFIHGKSDNFIPSKMTIQNYEACKNKEKKLLLVECVNHARSYLADTVKVQRAVKSFLFNLK